MYSSSDNYLEVSVTFQKIEPDSEFEVLGDCEYALSNNTRFAKMFTTQTWTRGVGWLRQVAASSLLYLSRSK